MAAPVPFVLALIGVGPMEMLIVGVLALVFLAILFAVAVVVMLLLGVRVPVVTHLLGRSAVEFKKVVKEIEEQSETATKRET